jgi:hypothetical protein
MPFLTSLFSWLTAGHLPISHAHHGPDFFLFHWRFYDSMAMIGDDLYLLLGCALGIDPIWFGVMVVIVQERGSLPCRWCQRFCHQRMAPETSPDTQGYPSLCLVIWPLYVCFPILATWLPALVY